MRAVTTAETTASDVRKATQQAEKELCGRVGELRSQVRPSVIKFSSDVEARLAPVLDKLGLHPQVRAWRPQPDWVEWSALVLASFSFAVLFKARRRDYPWVMGAAIAGYMISRYAGLAWGSPAGIFLSALALTAAGNAFGRWMQRPGALVRLPGIIMLVPGSASLRGLLTLVQQQDVDAGQNALLLVTNIVLALVAGLLFGNLLIPARKNL